MDVEVKHSGLKACMRCGSLIRIAYVDGEFHYHVEADPIDDNPVNPVYLLHHCEGLDDTGE